MTTTTDVPWVHTRPDWILEKVDRGSSGTFALHLTGLNLNNGERFYWSVDLHYGDATEEQRYDWSGAEVTPEAQAVIDRWNALKERRRNG